MSGISLRTGTKRHAMTARGADLYETPPEAVHALLRAIELPRTIWEPACGPGNIVNVLLDHGHEVYASDLYHYPLEGMTGGLDFLRCQRAPEGTEAIVTNPPFSKAEEFVRRARQLVPLTVMLLRLQFLEAVRRTDLLESGDLREVLVFRDRLPMMHRAGWQGKRASSAMAFAWFVWDREHSGPPVLRRISWRDTT